jgi:hypothetical protein
MNRDGYYPDGVLDNKLRYDIGANRNRIQLATALSGQPKECNVSTTQLSRDRLFVRDSLVA